MATGTRDAAMSIGALVAGVLRTMSVAAPIAVGGIAAAHGQPAEPLRLEASIPAQPLAAALEAFARQTGLQLVYVSDVVGSHRSSAAAAGLTPRDALARLLRGTGLRFEFLTANTIRIIDARPTARPSPPIVGSAVAEEVIVTASRREESAQAVPITIQVLSSAALVRLGVTTFDDLVLQLPGMTARGVGPSQNTICMRGLCTSEFANQSAGVNSSFPNVAVYLDEQPAQLPGRNLDVYAADLERIEVLEGPQGTLFGAGAEAGVLRYITNKPKIDVTEFVTTAGYAQTAHGAPSRSLEAALNAPIVAGTLAVRAVVYNERRGGYIDNLPATFARSPEDPSLYFAYSGGQVPANSITLDNFHLAARDINPVTYNGVRIQALYEINDHWSALVGQSFQRMDADGVFAEMAADALGHPQPDLTVQAFNPSYDSDRFENTALTVEGRIGALRLLYAGAYLVRNVEQLQDYTSYVHAGKYVDYYQCINPSPGDPATARCFSPSSTWRDVERNTHQSHEVRFRTAEDRRVQGIGGLFYEDYRIQDQGDWFYVTALPYFQPVGPPTGYYVLNGQIICGCSLSPGAVFVPNPPTSNNPNPRPLGDGFFNDVTRGYQQKAAYASIDVDVIPGALTLTAGTRYFRLMNQEAGSYGGSFACQLLNDPAAPNPCLNRYAVNLDALGLRSTNSGFRSRVSVRWTPWDDAMLYYTWSQGLRTGGFNRSGGTPAASPLYPGAGTWQAQAYAHGGWAAPRAWTPDGLVNNELGWKTSWFDHRVLWSGALYQEDWDRAQAGIVDTSVFGSATINAGSYRIRGLETAAEARVGDALTLEAGAAWNHSELVRQAPLYWADGAPVDFSSMQTSTGQKITNPAGLLGSPLAGSPPLQARFGVRFETKIGTLDATARVGVAHQSHSLATTDQMSLDLQGQSTAYDLPAFTTVNAAFAVGRGDWTVQLLGENLTDTRAVLYANYALYYRAATVNRPRTIGLRLTYRGRRA